jgi:hypothetical protein
MKQLIIRIGLGLAVLRVVGLLVAALFLGSIVKRAVETAGPKLTGTAVTLVSANLSLLSGSARRFAELNGAVVTAAAKVLAGEATQAAGESLKGVTDKAAKGLGDLLQKK